MRKLEELLEDYKSGLLSPEEERFVEEQLTEKPELLEEAQAIAFVWEAVKQQVKQDEKEKLKAQLLKDTELREVYEGERMKAVLEKKRADQRKRTRLWGQLAAASVVLIGLVYWISSSVFNNSSPQDLSIPDLMDKPIAQNILETLHSSRTSRDLSSIEENGAVDKLNDSLRDLIRENAIERRIALSNDLLGDSLSSLFKSPEMYFQLGVAYYHNREYENAQQAFAQISNPQDYDLEDYLLWYQGRLALHFGDEEAAQKALCRLIKVYDPYEKEGAEQLLKQHNLKCNP